MAKQRTKFTEEMLATFSSERFTTIHTIVQYKN